MDNYEQININHAGDELYISELNKYFRAADIGWIANSFSDSPLVPILPLGGEGWFNLDGIE